MVKQVVAVLVAVSAGAALADVPASVTNIGTLQWGNTRVSPYKNTMSLNLGSIGPAEYAWVRMEMAGGTWLDLETTGSMAADGSGPMDTSMALFHADGSLVAANDDCNGPCSLLSFGAPHQERSYPGVGPAVGQDGLHAGWDSYYLVIAAGETVYGGSNFSVFATCLDGGELTLKIHTDAFAPACSYADVGLCGGIQGSDRMLDMNDFVSYINGFFNQEPIADLGSQGAESRSDGAFDNNDFVVFINKFFTDAPGCTG